MKKYFRFHAGSLDTSMKTQVEVENINDIEKLIYENPCFPKEKCLFLYIDEEPIKDERIAAYGWGDTEYKVLLTMNDGIGRQLIGYTNFRMPTLAEKFAIKKERQKLYEKACKAVPITMKKQFIDVARNAWCMGYEACMNEHAENQ